jgi:hypothetical protein
LVIKSLNSVCVKAMSSILLAKYKLHSSLPPDSPNMSDGI